MKRPVGLYVFFFLGFCAASANATYVYDFRIFNNPTYNDNTNLGFRVEVIDEGVDGDSGNNLVGFKFENDVLVDSSISHVYFDNGDLLLIHEITSSAGVSFSLGASPGELPGSSILDPDFETSEDFLSDADAQGGKSRNGIDNSDEWLEIIFQLNGGATINNVINQINLGGSTTESNIRIGLKIISMPDDDSASAVNVPEPATIALLGLGVLGLLRKRRA